MSRVIIEMVAGQVGEGGGGEREPVEPVLVEPMARRFDRDVVDRRRSASIARSRWSVTGSGVVRLPGCSTPGPTMPIVPRLAARRRQRSQIWRVNTVTEVLPLVPVTATIVFRLRRVETRGDKREAPPRIGVGDDLDRWRAFAQGGEGRGVVDQQCGCAARTASSMKRLPSVLLPASAAKRKPGFTARESAVRPSNLGVTAGSCAVRARTPSMRSVSRKFPPRVESANRPSKNGEFRRIFVDGLNSDKRRHPLDRARDAGRRDPAAGGEAEGLLVAVRLVDRRS